MQTNGLIIRPSIYVKINKPNKKQMRKKEKTFQHVAVRVNVTNI